MERDKCPFYTGSMWDSKSAPVSKDTQNLLRTMMNESKLTHTQQKNITRTISKNGTLPPEPVRKIPQPKKPPPGVLNPRNYSGGVRTRSMIEQSGVLRPAPYKPQNMGTLLDENEKDRLANILAFGEDGKKPTKKRDVPKMRTPSPEPEPLSDKRFDELWEEVQERQNFLEKMTKLGKGQQYKTQMETEISMKVREMELIDRKRSQELEQILKERGTSLR